MNKISNSMNTTWLSSIRTDCSRKHIRHLENCIIMKLQISLEITEYTVYMPSLVFQAFLWSKKQVTSNTNCTSLQQQTYREIRLS